MRIIAQYNLIARDTLRDPETGQPFLIDGSPSTELDQGEFGFNALVAYEPSPGTLMYVGWTRRMDGPETYRLQSMERAAEGLFVKVSFLLRR